ncbi:hypothetical protein KKF84_19520 [Myxococcota bacterium]|nr:hypothetical protein [Myxococcota bacterium]MBU1537513.1 hypothetical protein [Myxococcota bacterium]
MITVYCKRDTVFANFNHATVRAIADTKVRGTLWATYQGRTITHTVTIH